MIISKTVEVEVDIEFDDIVEFIKKDGLDSAEKQLLLSYIIPDEIYSQVLQADDIEGREKIKFIKEIFNNFTLDELKIRLSK